MVASVHARRWVAAVEEESVVVIQPLQSSFRIGIKLHLYNYIELQYIVIVIVIVVVCGIVYCTTVVHTLNVRIVFQYIVTILDLHFHGKTPALQRPKRLCSEIPLQKLCKRAKYCKWLTQNKFLLPWFFSEIGAAS